MRQQPKLHKARNQRFRTRAADFEDRKPFERFPLWLRILSSLPLPAWYGIASFLAFPDRVMRKRHESSTCSSRPASRTATRPGSGHRSAFYRNFADVSVEIIKAVTMKEEDIARRVTLENEEPRARPSTRGSRSSS